MVEKFPLYQIVILRGSKNFGEKVVVYDEVGTVISGSAIIGSGITFVYKTCSWCGKKYPTYGSGKKKRVFCSRSCSSKSRFGAVYNKVSKNYWWDKTPKNLPKN